MLLEQHVVVCSSSPKYQPTTTASCCKRNAHFHSNLTLFVACGGGGIRVGDNKKTLGQGVFVRYPKGYNTCYILRFIIGSSSSSIISDCVKEL